MSDVRAGDLRRRRCRPAAGDGADAEARGLRGASRSTPPRPRLPSLDRDFDGPVVTDIRMPRHERPAAVRPHQGDRPRPAGDPGHRPRRRRSRGGGAQGRRLRLHLQTLSTASAWSRRCRRAAEKRRLVLENRRLREAAAQAADGLPLIGEAPAIRRLRETLRQIADTDVDVLVDRRDRNRQGGGGGAPAPMEPAAARKPSSR